MLYSREQTKGKQILSFQIILRLFSHQCPGVVIFPTTILWRAGRSKTRELIKYDPRNLSRVYWQDQQGNYWPISYRNLGPVSNLLQ